MSCRDLINSRWTVGGDFRALPKKFAKFDNVIPGLYVKIVHGGCDIEGWTLRAYFKKPGATESGPCLYLDGIVSNDEVIFDLKGTLFGEFGVWEVSLVLNGLGISPNKESIASNNSITYEVIKNCEGLEVPPIPPQSTQNTVDELIIKLQNKIDEANTIVNATSIFSTDNVLKDTDVDTGVSIDNLRESTELYFSLDTTNAHNIPYTAHKEVFVQSLKGSNEYRITEKSGNSNAVEDEVSLSFYLNETTNTIHYKVDWGSNVISEGIDIIAYERSGTINDLLEKGAGYDSSKYPNGKAITEVVEENTKQIQNCLPLGYSYGGELNGKTNVKTNTVYIAFTNDPDPLNHTYYLCKVSKVWDTTDTPDVDFEEFTGKALKENNGGNILPIYEIKGDVLYPGSGNFGQLYDHAIDNLSPGIFLLTHTLKINNNRDLYDEFLFSVNYSGNLQSLIRRQRITAGGDGLKSAETKIVGNTIQVEGYAPVYVSRGKREIRRLT